MAKATEFILRPGVLTVIVAKPYPASFPALIQRMEQNGSIQVAECETSLEAVSVARRLDACILLCSILTDPDVNKHLTMLKLLATEISKKKVRCLITTAMRGGALTQKLNLYGAAEIIPEPTNEKSLYFKVERNVRSMAKLLKSEEEQAAPAAATAARRAKKDSAEAEEAAAPPKIRERGSEKSRAVLVDPVELESDCWLLTRDLARRIGGKWVIKLSGPPPDTGRWTELPSEDIRETFWQWSPLDPENDPFIKEQGAWVFRGQRPEYQEEHWHFIGKSPELAFYYEGQSYGARIATAESGDVQIARDSEAAKGAYTLIQEAIEGAFRKTGAGADARAPQKRNSEMAFEEDGTERREERDPGPVPEEESAEAEGDLSFQRKSAEPAPRRESGVELTEPLELESDIWLLEKKKPLRVAGRWSVKLAGPGPSAGKWIEIQAEETGGEDHYWQWTPTDPDNDPFIKEQGAWIFRGNIPRFDNERWIFSGERPELSFYFEGESYGTKIAVSEDGWTMSVAADSESAKAHLPEIKASLVKVIRHVEMEEASENSADLRVVADGDGTEPPAGEEPGAERDEDGPAGERDRESDHADEPEEAFGGDFMRVAHTEEARIREFFYEESHFGTPGGNWHYVSPRADGGKWYVYVPLEIKNHVVDDVRALKSYWLYWGTVKPDLHVVDQLGENGELQMKRNWVFRAREPEQIDSFARLPEKIRDFLTDKNLQEELMVDLHLLQNEESAELSAKQEGPGEGKELSITLDKEREARELSGVFSEEEATELSGTFSEDEPNEIEGNLREEKLRESQDLFLDAGKRRRSKDLELRDPAPSENKPRKPPLSATMAAPRPPGTLLSPIALAFLMSELMVKRNFDMRSLGQRFCTYLSASCQGARVELWKADGVCVGTHDGSPGELLRQTASVVRAPVTLMTKSGKIEAAFLLVRPAEGSGELPASYFSAVAEVARGLVKALTPAA